MAELLSRSYSDLDSPYGTGGRLELAAAIDPYHCRFHDPDQFRRVLQCSSFSQPPLGLFHRKPGGISMLFGRIVALLHLAEVSVNHDLGRGTHAQAAALGIAIPDEALLIDLATDTGFLIGFAGGRCGKRSISVNTALRKGPSPCACADQEELYLAILDPEAYGGDMRPFCAPGNEFMRMAGNKLRL